MKRFRNRKVKSLQEFSHQWKDSYARSMRRIPLFDQQKTRQLTRTQQEHFARTFYHIRGHFNEFLWFLGNNMPDATSKRFVVDNIAEEFGGDRKSHEQLYLEFAANLGISETDLIREENYPSWVREYNQQHLAWLHAHDWQEAMAAFAAYERLDNIDYTALLRLVQTFEMDEFALLFFKVHIEVRHFDMLFPLVEKIWDSEPVKIISAFEFIGDHQLEMWRRLKDEILNI